MSPSLLNYTGTITDIDYPKSRNDAEGLGRPRRDFLRGQEVQRFNEAKVGDKVSMDYYLGVSAEVRKPTAEEKQNPLVVLDTASIAGPEAAPGPMSVRQIRAVVTIESLDRRLKPSLSKVLAENISPRAWLIPPDSRGCASATVS